MSVTFFIPNSPTKVIDTWECQCVDDGKAWPSCLHCMGTGTVTYEDSAWPTVNMANVNAMNVLRAIGFEPDYDGVWEGETLDRAIEGCLRALNSEKRRSVATRDAYHIPGGHAGVRVECEGNVTRFERMGAEVHGCAYTDDTVRMRVAGILEVCRKAKAEGEKVAWG
jgi:hypothetical protein